MPNRLDPFQNIINVNWGGEGGYVFVAVEAGMDLPGSPGIPPSECDVSFNRPGALGDFILTTGSRNFTGDTLIPDSGIASHTITENEAKQTTPSFGFINDGGLSGELYAVAFFRLPAANFDLTLSIKNTNRGAVTRIGTFLDFEGVEFSLGNIGGGQIISMPGTISAQVFDDPNSDPGDYTRHYRIEKDTLIITDLDA